MNLSWVRISRSTRILAAAVVVAAAAGIAAVHLVPLFKPTVLAPPSFCLMKLVTGYPCLACRGTRATMALANGDILQALRFNPLATLSVTTVLAGALTALLTGRLPIVSSLPRPWITLGWCLLAVALLGNWAYVIAAGG